MSARHLYVHLPFCASRCGYCDFVTVVGRSGQHEAYVDALLAELRRLTAPAGRRWLVLGLAGGLAAAGVGITYYAAVGFRCEGAEARLEGIWDERRKQEVRGAILGTELSYAADTWGRIEPRLDRKTKSLAIVGIWFEAGFDPTETPGFLPAMADMVEAYRSFVGAENVTWPRTRPERRSSTRLRWSCWAAY